MHNVDADCPASEAMTTDALCLVLYIVYLKVDEISIDFAHFLAP